MREVTEVENEIQAARSLYNQNVEFYNSRSQAFPASLIAGQMTRPSFPYLRFEAVETDASKLIAQGFAA
jgi:hypothetical protein